MQRIPVLWLCGPPGVGKTTVGWEIYERLIRAGSAPAYVDVDQLGMCYPEQPSDPARHRLKARNVGALRANYSAAGARCLVVEGVVEASHGPETDAVGGGEITVCRLRADRAQSHEAERLDQSRFTEWCLDATELSVEAAANAVLARLDGWPSPNTDTARAWLTDQADGESARGEVLWLCGPTGVGKSTVGFSLYLSVLRSGVPAGYVDVDQLDFCGTRSVDHFVRARNLAALWANFQAAGAKALVVVGPVSTTSDLLQYEQSLPMANFTWCRLHANELELTARILTRREGGSWAQPGDPLRGRPKKDLVEVAKQAVADAQRLEGQDVGLRIDVDDLAVDEAADRILSQTRWPPRMR